MAVPKPWFYAMVALLVGLSLFLLVLVLYGALGHAWDGAQHGGSIRFHNTTDTLLCYGSPSCSAPIKPRATSYWAMDCYSVSIGDVSVYTSQGRLLYAKTADCDDWTGSRVVINERDGEFVIADTIIAQPEAPATSD